MTSLRTNGVDGADDTLVATICLSLVPGVGPRLQQALVTTFGSARDVLQAAPSQLREVPGVGRSLAYAIAKASSSIDVRAELDVCRQESIAVLAPESSGYPRLLREIHDPPGVLYVRGELAPSDAVAVALVGTRHATSYGQRIARQLAIGLAGRSVTVVSGLARGIDAAAHAGALEANGRTLAVMAHGLDTVYPMEHRELAFRIAEQGALLAETPPRVPVQRGSFPRRNRLISGISVGVVVVEAGERSGALITARHALEQGREVFAVPGRVDGRASRGCHALLRDGAHLVESVDDILAPLGPLVESAPDGSGGVVRHPAELQLNDQERLVLQAIATEPTLIDQIVVTTGLPVPRVLSTLSVLEMRHLVRRISGHTVVRA